MTTEFGVPTYSRDDEVSHVVVGGPYEHRPALAVGVLRELSSEISRATPRSIDRRRTEVPRLPALGSANWPRHGKVLARDPKRSVRLVHRGLNRNIQGAPASAAIRRKAKKPKMCRIKGA